MSVTPSGGGSASVSLRDRIVRSSVLAVGTNVISKSIGIVSMLVLARLLTPEDYGIVAAAMLVIYLFDVLSQTGTDQYILTRPEITDEELHTAWTLRLVVRAGLAVAVAIASPWFAEFFRRDVLVPVLLALCIIPVIEALQSPGTLLLRRDFRYGGLSVLNVTAKLVSFALAVGVALITRSYWALVVGNLTLAATFMLGSYRLHAVRPRLTLSNIANQWSFSKWTLMRAIVGYVRAKVDNFALGRHLGVMELGVFTVSKQLGTMPHDYLTSALGDIFMSSIGGASERLENAARSFSRILVIIVSVMLPFTLGMHLAADIIVAALLGQSWAEAGPVIAALAPLTLTFSVCAIVSNALTATGQIRVAFMVDLLSMLVVASTVIGALAFTSNIAVFAWTRTLAGVLVMLIFYGGISFVLTLPHRQMLVSMLPALIAGVIMGVVVQLVRNSFLVNLPSQIQLIVIASVGSAGYFFALVGLLYAMRGRTDEIDFMTELLARYLTVFHARPKKKL